MGKTLGLSERDAARLQRALRFVEDIAIPQSRSYRRIRGTPAGGGGGGGTTILNAFCKEDAPAGKTIDCWLEHELPVSLYSETATYEIGLLAYSDGKYYLSITANNVGNALNNATHWAEIEAYDEAKQYVEWGWCIYDYQLWRAKQTSTGETPEESAYWSTAAPAWSGAITYPNGYRVLYSSKLWKSLQNSNLNKEPGVEEDGFWSEITDVEVYCEIVMGDDLTFAIPLLRKHTPLKYESRNNRNEATTLFQACEETCAKDSILEVVSDMLVAETTNSSTSIFRNASISSLGLVFPAQANSTYAVEFSLLYTAAAITTGIKLQLTGPSSPDAIGGVFFGQNTLAPLAINAYDTPVVFTASLAGINLIRGELMFRCGATAGRVTLQFASEVEGSLVTVLRGSSIKYRRVYRPDPA